MKWTISRNTQLIKTDSKRNINPNGPITSKGITSGMKKKVQEKENPGCDGFILEFYQLFKK